MLFMFLAPLPGTSQHVTVRLCNFFWKLACAQLVFANRKIPSCTASKISRLTARRERNDHPFARKPLPDSVYGSRQVTVARDKECCIEPVIKGIFQQLHGDVHVGLLLFILWPRSTTGTAPSLLFQVMTKLALHIPQGQCFQIQVLSLPVFCIQAIVANTGRKIMCCGQRLARLQQVVRKLPDIQPVVPSVPAILQPEVQVEAIHIGHDARHHLPHERRCSGLTKRPTAPTMTSLTPPAIASPGRRPARGVSFCAPASSLAEVRITSQAPPSRRRCRFCSATFITPSLPVPQPGPAAAQGPGSCLSLPSPAPA